MFTFDLKSRYHHIDIFVEHWQYLGFSWIENGVTYFYVFVVLPFGLSTAGQIFTKVCRVPIKTWRRQGIRIVQYLDDGIGAASGGTVRATAQLVKASLQAAGFVINMEKSVWEPTQLVTWLGIVINTRSFTIKITQKRIEKTTKKMQQLFAKKTGTARTVSSAAGSVVSQEVVLGPVVLLFCRNMYAFIRRARNWDHVRVLPLSVREELEFWMRNIDDLNEKHLRVQGPPVKIKTLANSDASDFAGGAVLRIGEVAHTAHKNLTVLERSLSSTWRELDAILFSLKSFAPLLRHRSVAWATDNEPATRIIRKGSKRPHLQELAREIYVTARSNNINLHVAWIPRELNREADCLSKEIDYDDWCTTAALFYELDHAWGPHTIDRFASSKNAKTRRFNSRMWTPGCEAVNAFAQDWGGEFNWVVPPVSMIPDVIEHARECAATGTLIVPFWQSAPFWPMLLRGSQSFDRFVRDIKIYPKARGLLQLGDFKRSLLGSSRFKSPLVAIQFSFQ